MTVLERATRCAATCLALCLTLGLAACGGGGGGTADPVVPPPQATALTMSTATPSILVERDLTDTLNTGSPLTLSVNVIDPAGKGYYYSYQYTQNAISYVGENFRTADSGIDFQIGLVYPTALSVGNHEDSFVVRICADQACTQPAKGSPLTVSLRVVKGYFAPTETGLEPLAVAARSTLAHNLVDAAYSAALDAIVSVSSAPSPALNVLDLATGQTRSVALLTAPTALSLAPDGLRAAVGHDAAISVVGLALPGSPNAMPVTRLPISLPVGALVFDAHERVQVFGNATFSQNGWHSLDLASGVDTNVLDAAVYGRPHVRLHPSGNRMYFANQGVSPDDIFSVDLQGDPPGPIVDSPYHGDYAMCGKLWLSRQGDRIYTACGATFSASATPAQDMRYTGAMALFNSNIFMDRFAATSLSESPDGNTVLLLERRWRACDLAYDPASACFSHFASYDATTLALKARYSLGPITVGTDRFGQEGRFLFHRNNGKVVMLSELKNAPDLTASVVLSLLP